MSKYDIKANYRRWATLFFSFLYSTRLRRRETTLAALGAPVQGVPPVLGTGKVVGNERLINLRTSLGELRLNHFRTVGVLLCSSSA